MVFFMLPARHKLPAAEGQLFKKCGRLIRLSFEGLSQPPYEHMVFSMPPARRKLPAAEGQLFEKRCRLVGFA